MSSKFSTWLLVLVLTGTVGSLVGCGGGEEEVSNVAAETMPTEDTTNDAQTADDSAAQEASGLVSYGGESSSGRGRSNEGAEGGMDVNAIPGDYSSEGTSGDMFAGMTPGDNYSDGANLNDGMNAGAIGGNYGGEGAMPGFGDAGMFGQGANGGGIQMVSNFMRQNCFNCHSGNNTKGDVRLDQLNSDIASAPDSWRGVVETLESGTMPPRNAPQPDQRLKTMVVEFIQESLQNAPELTYMQQAEVAFKAGESEKASQLFYAHLITADDSEAAELAGHFKIYRPVVSKPEDLTPTSEFGKVVKPKLTTQIRLGVGILLKLTGQVTDVKPIGVNQFSNGAGAGDIGGGYGGEMRGPGGNAPGTGRLEAFEDLTGDLGQAVVSAFDGRRGSGNYGTLFSSVTTESDNSGPAPGMIGSEGGYGNDAMLSGDFNAIPGSNFGPGNAGMSGDGMGMGPDGSGARRRKTAPGSNLANGLLYLGKAETTNDLLKKTVEAGVDGIFVFEIVASKNFRTNIVTSDTKIRFMLPSGKVVATGSKTLKNTDIERAVAMGRDANDVQSVVDQIFKRIDGILTLSDLPQISAAAAWKQTQSQILSDADRLQVLAEARMFNAKGIFSREQLEMVYQIIYQGNEGTVLANGSTDDRKLVLTSYTQNL